MQITENLIPQLASPPPTASGQVSQVFYRDSALTGFAVRVTSGGTKSYVLERRIRGKVKRITLGRCDEMALSRARARAEKLIGEIERENAPRVINGRVVDKDIELRSAYEMYLHDHPRLSRATLADYQRSLLGPLMAWQYLPVREVSQSLVLARHKAFDGKEQARFNNAMRLLRAILNYVRLHLITAEHKPIIRTNPVDVLTRRKLWYPNQSGDKKPRISSESLKRWWQGSMQIRKASTREYLHFLLLSGLPHGLVSRLRYGDIDLDNRTVTICTNESENALQVLPLSDYLVRKISERAARQPDKNDFIFPGIRKGTPLHDPRSAITRIYKVSGIRFNPKDLHDAFLSLAAQANLDPLVLRLFKDAGKYGAARLSEDQVEVMRGVQERVFLTVFFLVGAIK